MPEGSAGWVEDEVNHYGLTEVIILKFLKDDCNISGTDEDFNVKVILKHSDSDTTR